MANISGQDELVTKQELAAFYQAILPYLGQGSSSASESILDILDTELSDSSTNPVQNKVINSALRTKQDLEFIGTTDEWEALSTVEKAKYSIVNITNDYAQDELMNVYSDSIIGSIVPFGGTTAPNGWFICDGQAISRTEYSELFKVIGTNFGEGDGSTTFNVPDLRGEFIRGTGTNSHANQGSGANVGVHQDGTAVVQNIEITGSVVSAYLDTILPNEDSVLSSTNARTAITKEFTYNNGKIVTSRPTNTSVNFIIKAKHPISPMSDIIGDTDISAVGSTVTEAISNLGNKFNFSTEEQVVGTWIDGKPIYQKVLTDLTWTNGEWVTTSLSKFTELNIDSIVSCDFSIPGDRGNCIVMFSKTGGLMAMATTTNTGICIFRYTKTTD